MRPPTFRVRVAAMRIVWTLFAALCGAGALASAALAASIFHFGTYTIEETKRFMAERGVPVRFTA